MLFRFSFFSVFFLCSSAAVLSPVRHDRSTGLYSLSICTKTPCQDTNLLVDLGSSFNWIDCSHNYTSSTYRSIPCTSSLCNSLGSHGCSGDCSGNHLPGCSKNSCFLSLLNSGKRKGITKALALIDSLALPLTDGRNPGPLKNFPNFIFSCSATPFFRNRRPKGTAGLAGLSQSNFSLIGQLSKQFSLPRVFALCLSRSPSAPGVAFFGTFGPYYFHPLVELPKNLIYTPLFMTNPAAGGGETLHRVSDEYFIRITAIKVNNFVINVNGSGSDRAMLSTTIPYTTLHSAIYRPLIEAFLNESAALNLRLTQPVKPFSVCFEAVNVSVSRLGPLVPTIDFVMQNPDVFWRVHGSNSMVRILNRGVDVWCLAFVDGGNKSRSSAPIVIGGHQMVDHLLQFDLDSKRLGFSSSVLVHNTMCANFNFTVNHGIR